MARRETRRPFPAPARRARRLFLALAVGAALFAVAGCGGTGESPAGAAKLLASEAFAAAVADPARVTVNVHVPDEGSIEGTDLWIPYDQIAVKRSELPDPSTPLAVYCRSGRMSATAVETLAELGYADVVELKGGMIAWEEAGRPLLPPRSS